MPRVFARALSRPRRLTGHARPGPPRLAPSAGGSALAVLLLLVTLGGCAKDPEELAREDANRAERQWVLLGQSSWDDKIIRYLGKFGFSVSPKDSPNPEARYGLTVTVGRRVDFCVINDSEQLAKVTYEISDLKTKDVVLTVSRGGWTGPCFVQWTDVFDELAEAVLEGWSSRKRS